MTIFDWLEAVTNQMWAILLENIWHSVIMGGTAILVAGTALLFNHYDWKRARILSMMTLLGLVGMHILGRVVFGQELNNGMGLKSTAMSFLIGLFLIVGYYLAGWISSLRPNPVVQLKMNVAKRLSMLALFLETSAMESHTVKKHAQEMDAVAYIKQVAASKMGISTDS